MIIYILFFLLILLSLIILVLILKISRSSQDLLLHQKLDSIKEDFTKNIFQAQSNLFDTQKNITEQLNKLYQEIGNINRASSDILNLTKSFQDILRPTKKRGVVGESILENLIIDVFPKELISSQYTFGNGRKVDFLIKLPSGFIPVDAKFSLEAFRNYTEAKDEDKERFRRGFIDTIKKRVDETAGYILPDEGTVDFSLMYVPSEAVYYFIITETSLVEYAHKKRVFIVGPNTFYAYLKTLLIGFEALKIERRAKFIYDGLKRIELEIENALREYGILGTHLRSAIAKYEEVKKRIESIQFKLTSMKSQQITHDEDKG